MSLTNLSKINLGCGSDVRKDWINVDRRGGKGIVVCDLDVFPYPMTDDSYDEIELKMILEHLEQPIKALLECIRIAKNHATIQIIVPHARSNAQIANITHKNFFTEHSFDKELLEEYELQSLELKSFNYIYKHKWKQLIPFKKFWNLWLNGIYDDMEFVFEVHKNNHEVKGGMT